MVETSGAIYRVYGMTMAFDIHLLHTVHVKGRLLPVLHLPTPLTPLDPWLHQPLAFTEKRSGEPA